MWAFLPRHSATRVHKRNIVVIGGSAGAVYPITELLQSLPEGFAGAILVTLHFSPFGVEWLSGRLSKTVRLPIASPRGDGDSVDIRERQIIVARPDLHLIVQDGRAVSSRGPSENLWRPAIDVLFRSAAVAYGSRVIGVLMSGELDDGIAGLQAIKLCGGLVVVQSPQDAAHPAMPSTAAVNVAVDYSCSQRELPTLLMRLVEERAPAGTPIPEHLKKEASMALAPEDSVRWMQEQGPPVALSCPECGGPLWPSGLSGGQFRCLVGHSFQLHSLVQGADEAIDRTLWAAIRLFEQRIHISRMLGVQERERGRPRRAELYEERARESHEHARKLRELHGVRRTFADAVDDAAG
jgi:two-component system, chemotaxis family, protein-glutamate methylesterase/glutaminase